MNSYYHWGGKPIEPPPKIPGDEMKTVSFEEYYGFLLNNPHLTEHITEGTEINAVQWLDADKQVMAQAVYWTTPPGEPTIKTYQIRES